MKKKFLSGYHRPARKDKMKPTELKELWEGCGFTLKELHPLAPAGSSCGHCGHLEQVLPSEEPYFVLYKPDGEQYNLWIGSKWDTEIPIQELYPPIDLNNLFLYAVSKAVELIAKEFEEAIKDAYDRLFFWWAEKVAESPTEPALTLFWILYPVITGKEIK